MQGPHHLNSRHRCHRTKLTQARASARIEISNRSHHARSQSRRHRRQHPTPQWNNAARSRLGRQRKSRSVLSQRLAKTMGLTLTCDGQVCSTPTPLPEILIGDMKVPLSNIRQRIGQKPAERHVCCVPRHVRRDQHSFHRSAQLRRAHQFPRPRTHHRPTRHPEVQRRYGKGNRECRERPHPGPQPD